MDRKQMNMTYEEFDKKIKSFMKNGHKEINLLTHVIIPLVEKLDEQQSKDFAEELVQAIPRYKDSGRNEGGFKFLKNTGKVLYELQKEKSSDLEAELDDVNDGMGEG